MLKYLKIIIPTENLGERGNGDGEEKRTNAEIEKLIDNTKFWKGKTNKSKCGNAICIFPQNWNLFWAL